jgi:hypothetical protein
VDESFPDSVAELREKLKRLRAELRRLDATGDRGAALKILGQMIATQKEFMSRWPIRGFFDSQSPHHADDGHDEESPLPPPIQSQAMSRSR